MRIAVPTFGPRVSPRFDCAETFLFVTMNDGKLSDQREVLASGWAPHERINELVELGTNGVLCGGIDWWSAESLTSAGILVRAGVISTVADALAALLRGDLQWERQSGDGNACPRQPCRADEKTAPSADVARPGARFGGHHGKHRRRRRGAIN